MFKIAILGTENSHARGFCNIIYKGHPSTGNIPYSDFEVIGLCGDSAEENEILKEITGGKAEISENGDKWVDEVDAVMVTARHGGKHLAYAKKYIEAGKPAFIDKPITIDPEEALELVRLAKKNNVPLCGGSMLAFVNDTQQLKQLVKSGNMEKIYGGSITAPINMKNEWGDFYFYSQHLVQIMTEVFGHEVESIIARGREDAATFIARYADYDVTGHYTGAWQYAATVYEKSRVYHKDISTAPAGALVEFQRFDHMVRTGKMPETYEDLISPVFILNAIDESLKTGEEVKVRKFSI